VSDDGVNADDVVSETSVQVLTVGRPGKRSACNSLLAIRTSDLDLIDHVLGFQVPDLDGLVGGSDQPVLDRGEDKGVDDVLGVQGVQQLALGQVPKQGLLVFSTGGAQGAIRRDGDGVQVTVVASQVAGVLQGAGRPDLDEIVPASRDEVGSAGNRREANAGDPVIVAALSAGELALTDGVPQLDGAIAGARDDLTVVLREGNRQDVLGVAREAGLALASGDFPQTQGVVPRRGQGELAVSADNDVGDEVVVAAKSTTGIAEVTLLASQVPDDDSLVTGRSQDGVRISRGSRDGGNPSTVTHKFTSEDNLISHFNRTKI